jgi:hypothetical protein
MNHNDKKIIDDIREFIKIYDKKDKYNHENFDVDAFLVKLFEIPPSTFSEKQHEYIDNKIVCDKGMITTDRLSNFYHNVQKTKYGTECVIELGAKLLRQSSDKDYQKELNKKKAIDSLTRKDYGRFQKKYGDTPFAQLMMNTNKPLFICAYSEKSLEEMLYMFYDMNNSKYKELDLLLHSRFYANKFEILSGVINNLITTHQKENGGYNEDLVLNFYKSPVSDKDDIYFNMIGLAESNSESESCGLVHDEYDYYELSIFGQDYVYEHKRNMQWVDTSQFLEMCNIIPGKNNF